MFRRGFTLIELIMVIVILGILAAVAIPNYFNLVGQAKTAAEEGVVGGVRGGIATYYANSIVTGGGAGTYPTALGGSDGAATAVNPLFGNVLSDPITKDWSKAGNVYTGPAGGAYTYTATTGAFRIP